MRGGPGTARRGNEAKEDSDPGVESAAGEHRGGSGWAGGEAERGRTGDRIASGAEGAEGVLDPGKGSESRIEKLVEETGAELGCEMVPVACLCAVLWQWFLRLPAERYQDVGR